MDTSESICDAFLGHIVMIVTRQYGSDYGSPVICVLGNLSVEIRGGGWSS